MTNNALILKTLIISGPDAGRFLQGMLTCDLEKLKPEGIVLGAACNRKGRVVANVSIVKNPDLTFHMSLPDSMIEILLKHLRKYVIAAKVEFNESDKTETIDLLDEIKNNSPHILPETSGLFTPQMISLEKRGAVDFKKGCYLGQEIVARTEHLGKLKRHIHQLSIPLEENKKPGDELKAGDEVLGTIVNIATDENEQRVLAVLKSRRPNRRPEQA